MDKIVSDKRDEIARLCKKYKVKRLDVLDPEISAEFGPGGNPLDFIAIFQESDSRKRTDAYLNLMVELADMFGRSRYVFLGIEKTPYDSYFDQEETRDIVYAA